MPSHQQLLPDISNSNGDKNVVIAIIDGPVEIKHACLAGKNLVSLEIFAPAAENSIGSLIHGTHVTSQIFANGDCGLDGVAPGCSGLLIPVYRGTADGGLIAASQVDLARAIRLAVDRGANIINISGGELSATPEADQFLLEALAYCEKQGVLVVAAAGNNGCECLHVPASVPTVIAVGALDPATGRPMGFSNWGKAYRANAILAPGMDIPGAQSGGGIATRSGTSFAAPIVSGVAALLMSAQRERGQAINAAAVRSALLRGASPCDQTTTGDCRPYLAGTLDPVSAFEILSASQDASAVTPAEADQPPRTIEISSGVAATQTEPGAGLRIEPSEEEAMSEHESTLSTQHPGGTNPPPPIEAAAHAVTDGVVPSTVNAQSSAPVQIGPAHAVPGHVAQSASADMALPPARQPAVPAGVAPSGVEPSHGSDCGCGGAPGGECSCGTAPAAPQLVFALGQLRYDLVTEARKDSLWQAMHDNPYDWKNLLAHLKDNPWDAAAVTWTLEIDATPIYAIRPDGAYAADAYKRLAEALKGQVDNKIERVSVPGWISGSAMLTNGITVPVVTPTMRGMYAWSSADLIKTATTPESKQGVENFLNRIYFDLRSLGQSPQERAINFAATNAFQADRVFQKAAEAGHQLDSINVERSPICRQDSDCWDVKLTTFDPLNDRAARRVHRFTVDVSDVVPCTVGAVRSWDIR